MEMEWPAFVALEFELSVSKQKACSTVSGGVRVRVNDNVAVCVCVCVMSSAAAATASNTLQVWPHIRKILEVIPRCGWQHSALVCART